MFLYLNFYNYSPYYIVEEGTHSLDLVNFELNFFRYSTVNFHFI